MRSCNHGTTVERNPSTASGYVRRFMHGKGTVLPATAAPSGRAELSAALEFPSKKLTYLGTDDAAAE
jgi:hypothetical protein